MAHKKQSKRRTFVLRNTTWRADILVVIGGTVEQAQTLADKKFGPITWKGTTWGRCFLPDDDKSCLVWFKQVPGGSLCAHECFHVALHILKGSSCYPITVENEEAFAYLLDWLVSEIGRRVW